MKSIEEAANCIVATNTPESAAFKARVGEDLQRGQADLNGLEQIERDARRQLEAVRIARASCGVAEGG